MENAQRFEPTTSTGVPMATEEEDIPNTHKPKKGRLHRTAFAMGVQFFLGMHLSQIGPALLDLQAISGTDVEGASNYVASIDLGYMIGCLMAGFLYDRLSNQLVLVCVPMTLASLCITLIPWCTSYPTMLAVFLITSILTGNADTAVTAHVMWMWKGKSDAATQLMTFAYSLGGVLGPLCAWPFLAPMQNASDEAPTSGLVSEFNNSTEKLRPTMLPTNLPQQDLSENKKTFSSEGSVIFYAFLTTCVVGLCFSIPFHVLCLMKCFQKKEMVEGESQETEIGSLATRKRLPLKAYVFLTLAFSISCFLFSLIEDSFNSFLALFVVSHLTWTKADGAFLTSLYWGIGTVTNLVLVLMSRRVDITKILLVSFITMTISLAAFLISGYLYEQNLVWISTSCFAMAQASIYGGIFTWADSKLLQLDGKATGMAMVSESLGSVAGSLVIGIMMDRISLMAFPYIVLSLSAMLLVQFLLVSLVLQPCVSRKYGPTRTPDDGGDEDEKESFVSSENVGVAHNLNDELELDL